MNGLIENGAVNARQQLPPPAWVERAVLQAAREKYSDYLDRQAVADEFHLSLGLVDKIASKLTRVWIESKPLFSRREIEQKLRAGELAAQNTKKPKSL